MLHGTPRARRPHSIRGYTLRVPSGRVHWAGTETSTVSHGTIDGAIRSGERAADEILAVS
jgi:monoamine oxidase